MKKYKRLLSAGLCLLLSALILAGCGGTKTGADSPSGASASASTPPDNGASPADAGSAFQQLEMIRMGEGGTDFPTPWLKGNKGGGARKHMLIYDSLLEKDDEGLIPWLAESYEIKEDGVTYFFKLRDNILWHDGEKMTADDVVFTFGYCAKFIPVSSTLDYDDIASVEAVDDLTVKIVTKEACATLLENIGTVSIIPKHIWENVEDPHTYEQPDALVGSGPYILTERKVSESVMIYEAFDDFWGPMPAAKTLYWMNVSDEAAAFEAGEIDIARSLAADEIAIFSDESVYKLVRGPAFSGNRLLFNMEANELLAARELRQAIYYAMDSQEMIDKIGGGIGEVSNAGLLPPAHIMYNPDVKQYEHDLDKADALLDALGYAEVGEDGIRVNENGERLSFELLASEREGRVDNAKLFAEQMARAGIEFVVIPMDGATQEEHVSNNEFVTAIVGHAGLGGDADYLRARYAGGELGASTTELSSVGYDNAEVLRLLEEQRTIVDFEKRKEMLYEIQELMAEDVVEIMMYYSYMTSAHRPDVWDGWMYNYDERSVTGCKMSYVVYDQWKDAEG